MVLKIKIRVLFFSLLVFVVGWLLYQGIVPSGHIVYHYDFQHNSAFISSLQPQERVMEMNQGIQKIIAQPVYFNLHTPRKFNKAEVNLRYKFTETPRPIMEMGVMVDKTIWRYELHPVQNKIIDSVCSSWPAIRENNLLFCQARGGFNNINEFLNASIDTEEIAVYNYKWDKKFLLPNYATATKEMVIDNALRGSYQFYTYIQQEILDFTFILTDLNQNKDADRIDLNLYYEDILIDTRHLDDDGNINDDQKVSPSRELKLQVFNLPEGIYKIELRVNEDIVTNKIMSQQNKLAFINKINLAHQTKENLVLYTDGNRLSATTIYPDSLQVLKIGNEQLNIKKSYQQFSVNINNVLATSSVKEIIILHDGLILSTNGVFSFDKSALINPAIKKVDTNLDMSQGDLRYILADYKTPRKIDNWQAARLTFNLTKAYRENRNYSFIISIPGLSLEDGLNDFVAISDIKIELSGDNLWELIKKKFGKYE